MEYRVLTPDHQRAMWRNTIGQLEERHFALIIDRALALSVAGEGGMPHPEAVARAQQLDAQLAAVEQQHARAVAELGPEEDETPTPIREEIAPAAD